MFRPKNALVWSTDLQHSHFPPLKYLITWIIHLLQQAKKVSGVRQKEGGVTLKEHLNLLAGHVALQQVHLKFLVRYYQSSLFETVIYIWVLRLDFRSQGTWLLLESTLEK